MERNATSATEIVKMKKYREKTVDICCKCQLCECYKRGRSNRCQVMEVNTMQRTAILRGTVNKEYGKTIAEAINEKLDKNPEFELVQTTVLESSDVFCTLLCVFEKNDQEEK